MDIYNEYYGCYAMCQNSKVVFIDDLDGSETADSLPGPVKVMVWCGNCGCWMELKIDIFECPKCKQKVSDNTIYDAIQDANNKQNKEWDEYEDLY